MVEHESSVETKFGGTISQPGRPRKYSARRKLTGPEGASSQTQICVQLCNTSVEDRIFLRCVRSTLHPDGVPPHPPCVGFRERRVRNASGNVSAEPELPHDTGVSPHARCGQEEVHENFFVPSFVWRAAVHRCTTVLFRAAQSCPRNGSPPAHSQ